MRTGVVLAVVFGLAVAFGVVRAHTSPVTMAAPTAALLPTPTPAPPPDTVYIIPAAGGAHFVPRVLTVRPGALVTFVNGDYTPHSAVADNGSFDTGLMSRGEGKQIRLTKPGTYTYGDITDATMTGTIRVRP